MSLTTHAGNQHKLSSACHATDLQGASGSLKAAAQNEHVHTAAVLCWLAAWGDVHVCVHVCVCACVNVWGV